MAVGLAFLLAIAGTFVFAYRAGRHARQIRTENEPIRGWMSVPFIAHTHHVPASVLFQAIGVLPGEPHDRRCRTAGDPPRGASNQNHTGARRFRVEPPYRRQRVICHRIARQTSGSWSVPRRQARSRRLAKRWALQRQRRRLPVEMPPDAGFRLAWWPALVSTESSAIWNGRPDFCAGTGNRLFGSATWKPGIPVSCRRNWRRHPCSRSPSSVRFGDRGKAAAFGLRRSGDSIRSCTWWR